MFYIKPPSGQVSLHTMEKCVLARLEYLELLHQCKSHEFNGNFEYLLENSVHDKVGHFLLRLIMSISLDLWNHWIVRETLLFQSRLNHMQPRQLRRLFRSIAVQLRSFNNIDQLINQTLLNLSTFFLKLSVFKHLVSKTHLPDCKEFKFRVRFELLSDLIKTRELDLDAGYAIVYCSQWKQVLVSLFSTYVTQESIHVKSQARHSVSQDSRLNCLYQKIQHQVLQKNIGHGRITMENIDVEAQNFPPCMLHLHTRLRSVHRLSHYARLYYSLFLKDCGMQLEDAIHYWKEEYSKPHTCTSICSHNWQSSERKFIYSIRHLYGLEGSRKNYRSLDCKQMCTSISGPMYEGGCPFKNFDANTLNSILCSLLPKEESTRFLESASFQSPQVACATLFKMMHKPNTDKIIINNPVEYYLSAINSD